MGKGGKHDLWKTRHARNTGKRKSPFMERLSLLCLAFWNDSKTKKTAALYAEDIETAVIMFA